MNLENRDMSYFQGYQYINPELYLSKGVRVSRFRKSSKQIKNRLLYAILLSKNIKFSELAKRIGVSPRTVNNWVINGAMPNEENRDRVCTVLNYPPHLLFNEDSIRTSSIICIPHQSKYYRRVQAVSDTYNKVLHGLMILHDISVKDLSKWLEISPATLRKYLHNPLLPDPEYQDRLSSFFRVSVDLLFIDVSS